MLRYKHRIDYETGHEWLETNVRGKVLLQTPLLNKNTAYSQEERVELGLVGKLPYQVETIEQQSDRAYQQFKRYSSELQKYIYLNNLHDTNEVLFYKLVHDHLAEYLPLIYTPGVSSAVKEFSLEFRKPRGIYIAYPDMDKIDEILSNRTHPDVDLIVVTDGEGVLGIGDQGIGGIDIPIAKLMIYTLCGINPYRTLPIMLDMGTNNQKLLNDPLYLGWGNKRVHGEQFDEFISKFVSAVHRKFPQSMLHWEDLGRRNAQAILDQHQHRHLMFNDDMQGTGVVTLAALLAAIKATKIPLENQRIVVFGAGTAGMGIAEQLHSAMVRMGIPEDKARDSFWLVDRHGLIKDDMSDLTVSQKPYAKHKEQLGIFETASEFDLLTVVKAVKPTILIGCSTQRGAFSQEVIETMAQAVAKPIIFPLSNPTDNCEATPEQILLWSKGQALITTGSPFEPVSYEGKEHTIAQCNNALAFPGIGLGLIATRSVHLSTHMLWVAALALSEKAPVHSDPDGALLPPLTDMRSLAVHIAKAVAEQVFKEEQARVEEPFSISQLISSMNWQPRYYPIKPKT